ncbi:MAG: hypothetical protein H7A46_05000 [Verrucomicrobiales bacterium]|nr:hypothetical protein [Verrucomicrobiales bacterium]
MNAAIPVPKSVPPAGIVPSLTPDPTPHAAGGVVDGDRSPPLPTGLALGGAVVVVATFQLGVLYPALAALGLVWLGGLFALRRVASPRWAFYLGTAIGLGMYAPQLAFFWTVFGPAAAVLWLILAFWIGLFLLLLHRCERRLGPWATPWLAPVLWFGLEYFRSELYPLRFSWFTAGSLLPVPELAPVLRLFGVYGSGALAMLLAAWCVRVWESGARRVFRGTYRGLAVLAVGLVLGGLAMALGGYQRTAAGKVRVAGVQFEFPGLPEVLEGLNSLLAAHPETELILLSEYTLDGPPPPRLLRWCLEHARWLVVGGKAPQEGDRFLNTAFVINPMGEVVFQQAKSVPIQFFNDGEPAPGTRVWDSPWGPLGIAVCYDASYTRVIDRIVHQGAMALLLPAMDVEPWGAHQHRLNARVTRIRAAEYGLPVFRVASSGISQLTDSRGGLRATAGFPGQGEVLAGELSWPAMHPPTRPLDRYLVWPMLAGLLMAAAATFRRRKPRSTPGGGDPISCRCACSSGSC